MAVEVIDPASGKPRNAFRQPFRSVPRRGRLALMVGHRIFFGFIDHNGLSWAAAMAFWLVLSLPPLIVAVSSVAGVVIGAEARDALAEQITAQLPAEGGLIRDLVAHEIALLSVGGLISLIVLTFSASRVFAAVINAIYVMWRHVEPASLLRREAMRLLLVVVVGGMLVAGAVLQLGVLGMADEIGPLVGVIVSWVLPFLLVVAGLFVTYKLIPRRRASWQTALLGAIGASIVLRVAQVIFVFLLGTFLEFEEGYGPLAEVALLATWAFFASVIVLMGAEFVATLDRHRLTYLPLPSSKRVDSSERGA